MIFFITIIIAALTAVYARRQGFVTMWTHLFNVMTSVYLGIMFSPTVIDFMPSMNSDGYYRAGCILGIAVVIFIVTHQLVNTYLGTAFTVQLPKQIHTIGAVIVGFLTGLFAANFLFFLIGLTPASDIPFLENMSDESTDQVYSVVNTTCKTMHRISLQPERYNYLDVLQWFMNQPKSGKSSKSSKQPSPSGINPDDISSPRPKLDVSDADDPNS